MKKYAFGTQAREDITFVAEKIGDVLGKTLGPGGRNYFLPTGITNDGRTIIKEIDFATDGKPDECRDAVAAAFEETAARQDQDAGDGTTTAVVVATQLAQDIVEKIVDMDAPVPGAQSVMDLARQLEDECKRAVELLDEQSRPVESLEELERIAATSMEGHEAHKIVADSIWEGGKDAFTAIQEGFSGKVEKDVKPGIKYPLKVEAPYMYTNSRKEAVYEDVPVLVANHVFEAYSELSNFMMTKPKEQNIKGLVIVAKQFSVPFVGSLAHIQRQTGFPFLLLSGNLDQEHFEDIAAFVDAKAIDTHPKEGRKMSDVKFEDAGHAKMVIGGEDQSVFIGGRGLEAVQPEGDTFVTRVESHAKMLEESAEREQNPELREALQRRASGMQGGIATLYVDAKTAVDKYYLRLKVEDAMNSCKAALDEGMVKGGGQALKDVADQMEGTMLYSALLRPYQVIQRNAGGKFDIPENIVDACLSQKMAVENAVAVVKTLISTEGIVAEKEKDLVEQLNAKLLT